MTSLEKSLNQFNHLLAFDLMSYGAAIAILNRYVDDEVIKCLEVSPSGSQATLIFVSKDEMALNVIQNEADALFKDAILIYCLFI